MRQWLFHIFGKLKKPRPGGSPAPPRRQARLGVEALEARQVMTAALGAAALHPVVAPPAGPAQIRTVTAPGAANSPLQFSTNTAQPGQQPLAGALLSANALDPGKAAAANRVTPANLPAADNPPPDTIQEVRDGLGPLDFGLSHGRVVMSTDGGRHYSEIPGVNDAVPDATSFSVAEGTGNSGSLVAVTVLGKDGKLYQATFGRSSQGADLGSGGFIKADVPNQEPVSSYKTSLNTDGSFETVALTKQGHVYVEKDRAVPGDSGTASRWRLLESDVKEMQAIRQGTGALDVFTVDHIGRIRENVQALDQLETNHFDTNPLINLSTTQAIKDLQVARDSNGLVEVFAIGENFEVLQATEKDFGQSDFGDWKDLHHQAATIAVAPNADAAGKASPDQGQLHLFFADFDGNISVVSQKTRDGGGSFSWPSNPLEAVALPPLPGGNQPIASLQAHLKNNLVVLDAQTASASPQTFEMRGSFSLKEDGTFVPIWSDWHQLDSV